MELNHKWLRKHAWAFIPITALGGLWSPKLGLLIIPLMIILAVMGFLRGKYWCGNLCPHGSLFDGFLSALSLNRRIPGLLRSPILGAMAFCGFGYMLFTRLSSVAGVWGELSFWDQLGLVFVSNYLVVTIIGSLLAIVVAPRSWCAVCPMGTMQKLTYSAGRITGINADTDQMVSISDVDSCASCAACATACPMQLEPYKNFSAGRFESKDCIRCWACIKNCPVRILSPSGTSLELKQSS